MRNIFLMFLNKINLEFGLGARPAAGFRAGIFFSSSGKFGLNA
jgi:hypothetical protein